MKEKKFSNPIKQEEYEADLKQQDIFVGKNSNNIVLNFEEKIKKISDKRVLDEEKDQKIIDEWYEEANKVTIDGLTPFAKKLVDTYEHDYGTIVYAMTALALAAIKSVNKTDQGGISGFQASCIMWEFVRRFLHLEAPLRMINYSDMLLPQNEDLFKNNIDNKTFAWLKEQAKKALETQKDADPSVIKHWESIIEGKLPFGYEVREE